MTRKVAVQQMFQTENEEDRKTNAIVSFINQMTQKKSHDVGSQNKKTKAISLDIQLQDLEEYDGAESSEKETVILQLQAPPSPVRQMSRSIFPATSLS